MGRSAYGEGAEETGPYERKDIHWNAEAERERQERQEIDRQAAADRGKPTLGWNEERHLLAPDGTDPMSSEVGEHAEHTLAEMQARLDAELAKGIFSPDDADIRAMREAPDGAVRNIAPIRGFPRLSEEDVARMFGGTDSPGYLQAMSVAQRDDVDSTSQFVSSVEDVAVDMRIAMIVDAQGQTGIGVVLDLRDGSSVMYALSPYDAAKAIHAISQGIVAALDEQMGR